MKARSKTNNMFLLSFGIVLLISATISSAQMIRLTSDDFSAWRSDTGQWQIVGDVFTDPANEKSLKSQPGTGAMLNGPTGRTSHLFSRAEFGDIKAHIEFMVSKGSNSGIYFMGRYEIQVFDSYGTGRGAYPGSSAAAFTSGGMRARIQKDSKVVRHE